MCNYAETMAKIVIVNNLYIVYKGKKYLFKYSVGCFLGFYHQVSQILHIAPLK